MKTYASITLGLATVLILAACGDAHAPGGEGAASGSEALRAERRGGAVFTMSNAAGGNAALAFSRAADGSLTAAGSFATGGLGSGNGLGSQGSVAITDDGRYLLVVNAGSNDVSSFAVEGASLELRLANPDPPSGAVRELV